MPRGKKKQHQCTPCPSYLEDIAVPHVTLVHCGHIICKLCLLAWEEHTPATREVVEHCT